MTFRCRAFTENVSIEKVKGFDNDAIFAADNDEQSGEDVIDEGSLEEQQQRVEIDPSSTDWVQPFLGTGDW